MKGSSNKGCVMIVWQKYFYCYLRGELKQKEGSLGPYTIEVRRISWFEMLLKEGRDRKIGVATIKARKNLGLRGMENNLPHIFEKFPFPTHLYNDEQFSDLTNSL